MYKVIGCIMIISACSLLAYRRSFADYHTYLLLKETGEIAEKLRLSAALGEKYPTLFEKINLADYKFFHSFSFMDRERFSENLLQDKFLYKEDVKTVCEFLLSLGEKNKAAEQEYIQNNVLLLAARASYLLDSYRTNQKLNLIFGISVGIIISLVIL